MRVVDLAKELNVTTEIILNKLKAFKMKAKDGNQELSGAAVTVLRGELRSAAKSVPAKAEAPAPREIKPAAKEVKAETKAPVKETKAKETKAKATKVTKEKKITAKADAKKVSAKTAVTKPAAKTVTPDIKKEEP